MIADPLAPTVRDARYARGQKLAVCPSDGSGFKTRAMRLAGDHLRGRWSQREGGYIMSPTKALKLLDLYGSGRDCGFLTGRLFATEPLL